jgi:hypothetical protein
MERADDDRVVPNLLRLPPHGCLGVTDERGSEEVVRRLEDAALRVNATSLELTAHRGGQRRRIEEHHDVGHALASSA